MEYVQLSLFGKTSPEHFQADEERIFVPCSGRSQRPIFQCLQADDGQTPAWYEAAEFASHGASLTRNIGACPNVERESTLSEVLEMNVPQKYSLSPKACSGVLRRAKRRGKELPELLKAALESIVKPTMQEEMGGVKASTITGDHENRVTDYTTICVFDKSQVTNPKHGTKTGNVKTACTQTKTGNQCVVLSMDYATYNKGKNSKFSESISENGKAATQVAKGPGAVCYCIQGNAIDRAETAGCNGKGWKEEQSYTLNTIDRPAVVFKAGNGSKAGSVGFSSTVSPTLTSAGSGANQAPSCVVQAGNRYVVRRLTPLECERLQGFPDEWTKLEAVEDMTDQDLELFSKALQADAEVKGKQYRPKDKDQMIRWYNKLGSDSQRYKQLGNSLAIPCALRVVWGIAETEINKNGLYTISEK